VFRFTIRDVLWLMAIVGLAVAWWMDHRDLDPDAQAMRRLRQQFREGYEARRFPAELK